ncbi:2-succinyl-6-hydroxy-2,4-cyclohexadiene-1-carboxylate synthase [Fredinandcohnia quinoae]|uniref:Putative 2-succinyl-6-hydroxy-2,4-cyclohexadiene-1-carboxylate synthase n=1 Tax=Fredinandcohnia quinoae TaxID=2918902 RepID=A0AAW5E5W1_9BACI|nr:2-succinyl-6-hydroxy-2,4-cyclohexadiene-1-carboxylate synthase [Fredinandcohnia sp. SECRCQ15]MCH1625437.1 2-succinyl-6-hydroxy-2,4-cyclohexadiene-1-carboxylate synthase [Fredinandcohnia sp. SECRCQ15]
MLIEANEIDYYVEIVGEGEPLLFLHGFTGSSKSWKQIVSILQSDFQCILIDIIGHGMTDSPSDYKRYEIQKVACDILSILDSLKIKTINLVGYSMGGRLAIAIATLYQNRISKLILESSSPGLQTEEDRKTRRHADEKLAMKIEKEDIEQFVHYWENIPLFSSQKKLPLETQFAIRNGRLSNSNIGLANSLRGMGTGAQDSYWGHLSQLEIPTLLLCGQLDEKFCKIAESMKNQLPNARKIEINGAGHAIHVENPKFFGKIVSEFVNGH